MPRSRNFLITLLLNAIALAIVIPVLPSTLIRLSSNFAEAASRYSLIVSVFLVIYILGTIQVGLILDRLGRRLMLIITLLANLIGFALLVVPVSFLQILVARALNGYGQVSGNVIQASLADITSVEERPQIFGSMNSTLALAFIFGSSFAGLIANLSADNSLLYFLSLVFSLFSLCFSFHFCPETLRSELRVSRVRLTDLLGVVNRSRLRSFILLLSFNICNLGLLVIWPFYVSFRFGWGAFESGLTLALLAVAFAISQSLILPWFLRRFGFKKLVAISILSTTFFLIALGLSGSGLLFSMIPFFNLLGFTGVSLVQASLSSQVPDSQQGTLSSLFALFSSIGSLIAMGLFACVMALLTAAQIRGGPIAGSPFYVLALIMPICCLWKPHGLMRSLSAQHN
jgi:DHA1 family tetracycline resistance protein-like MFS transporter